MERLFGKIRHFQVIILIASLHFFRFDKPTTTITVMINIEGKNEMIREISVEIKRFIKEYVMLSLCYVTFLSH